MAKDSKETVPAVVTPMVPVPQAVALTPAETMWNDLKAKRIDIFGLPNQMVQNYCSPVPLDPSKLFLTFKVQAFLPALEELTSAVYNIERSDKYLIITRK